jgi:hypothetical protein
METNIIATEISMNPRIGLGDLSAKLQIVNESGFYSKPTICRIIKKMGFTRKKLTLVPINRNSEQNKAVRLQYARTIDNISNENLIFLDESGFNLHQNKGHGYSLKNTKYYVNVPNSKGNNVSLMCAISKSGLYAHKTKVGSYKSSDFVDFINNELPTLELTNFKIIVMDNAAIHRTSEVSAALRLKGYSLKLLLPYSPQLNPIE